MRATINQLISEQSRFIKVPAVVGSLIVAAGVLVTYFFADYLSQRSADDFQTQTDEQAMIFANTIESRTAEFEQILLMLAAYSRSQPDLTRDQWSQFVRQSKILDRHPFVLGVGYIDTIKPSDLEAYTAGRQSEIPGFTITPEGQREIYTAVRYLEPYIEVNNNVLGFDMYSEKTRQASMAKARDQATVSITSPVRLKQDEGKNDKFGVLIFAPVYRTGAAPDSIAERRQQHVGYTYISFRPGDFITRIELSNSPQLSSSSYTITDTSSGQSMTSRIFSPSNTETRYDAAQAADILDHQWMVGLTSYQPAFQRWTAPGITFLLGIVTSFAIGVVTTYLMARRLVRLDVQHQNELQQTKDELLALTSHQLRTPASGVKQYVGMLLQGFVGELSPQQEAIAKKAFAANERQLETINQLLHVAKADADQLVLQKEVIELLSLTNQVIESMQASIDEQEAIVTVKAPKKAIYVNVDERYVRMVIENLVSNALKYSKAGQLIKITVTARKEIAIVSIRDYGVGIAEEDIPRLFKKFSRIPNPLSKSVGGSGLGLFLAEQIMIAHHGDIEVDSKLGKGTIFTATMPLHEVKQETPRKEKE